MLVAIYTRVSTDEQAREGYSIAEQEASLRSWCQAKEWNIYDVYSDPGFSASNLNRPGMQRLLFDASNKRFDMVLVKRLDRFSRSQKDTLLIIEDVLSPKGIDFCSLTENFDTHTAFGKAVLGILSAFAQLERETIRERTRMGRTERAKDGYFHGGPHIPFGYMFRNSQLVINEYEAVQVREVHELFHQGKSITSILNTMSERYPLSKWNHSSRVYNVLQLPVYSGYISWRGEVYDGRHEAIISAETWEATCKRWESLNSEKLLTNKKRLPFKGSHLLSGMLRCPRCGGNYIVKGNYSGHGDKKVYRGYYTCISRAKTNKKRVRDPNCMNKSWPVVVLDQIVTDSIMQLSLDDEAFRKIASEDGSSTAASLKLSALHDRLHDLESQSKRLVDLYQIGVVPLSEITERAQQIQSEQASIINEIENCNLNQKPTTVEDAEKLLLNAESMLSKSDIETRQEYVRSLIEYIDIDGDSIIFHWAF